MVLTKLTPSNTASPVRARRNLRASTPLTVARSIPTGYVTLMAALIPLVVCRMQ